MKNFVQKGKELSVVLTSAASAGDVLVVGRVVAVAAQSGGIGDTVEAWDDGVYDLAKDGNAYAQGDKVYWDATAKQVTNTANSGANLVAGSAWLAALAGDLTVRVKLIGTVQ